MDVISPPAAAASREPPPHHWFWQHSCGAWSPFSVIDSAALDAQHNNGEAGSSTLFLQETHRSLLNPDFSLFLFFSRCRCLDGRWPLRGVDQRPPQEAHLLADAA